jgi:hypothetical protein
MPVPKEVEAQFIELLGLIYASVPWRKMSTSRNPWDVFNHRVRAAATRPTLGGFVSRLCNWFGLQSLSPEAVALYEALVPYERALLRHVHQEHITVAMLAVQSAKQRKRSVHARSSASSTDD